MSFNQLEKIQTGDENPKSDEEILQNALFRTKNMLTETIEKLKAKQAFYDSKNVNEERVKQITSTLKEELKETKTTKQALQKSLIYNSEITEYEKCLVFIRTVFDKPDIFKKIFRFRGDKNTIKALYGGIENEMTQYIKLIEANITATKENNINKNNTTYYVDFSTFYEKLQDFFTTFKPDKKLAFNLERISKQYEF